MRRVVITGIGAITPIGTGVEGLWNGLRREKSAVRRITQFDPSGFNSQIAAEIPDFKPDEHLDHKRLKRLDRFSSLAIVSSLLALKDACLVPAELDKERTGVVIGTALGGVGCAEDEMPKYLAGGLRAVNPMLALSVFGGAGSCNVAIQFGFYGYNTSNCDSCASGTIAIGNALNAIRRGDADVILAGAAEAPLHQLTFGAFSLIRAMSTRNDDPERACRPFDKDRDGFVMAEGSAVLVLEELSHALDRGANIYAEVCGFGVSNDGFHMAAPRADGKQAAKAMHRAIVDAGMTPKNIDYINAHGSSTPLNDSTETLAIKTVLGDRAPEVPISGTKAMHGHCLGATGAIETAICGLALERGWIPPTINLAQPEEGLDLDYVPHNGRNLKPTVILKNSFGFGGINAALVLAHPDR